MQSWFEVWKGVKTIQNFAAIEINRKFTKLNFTNSRMSLVWIKFSFSFQCGIFILLIFLIANQWRKPTTNGGNQWQRKISETLQCLRFQTQELLISVFVSSPNVQDTPWWHQWCAAGGGCSILSWQQHWRQQRQSWKLAAKNYCKTSSGSLCLSPHCSIALFRNKKSPTIKPTTRRPG